jgi:opacity protein-like surface antigen
MIRVTRFALVAMVAMLTTGLGIAQAQPVSSTEDGRFYAALAVAATLGHKSDSAIGVELGAHLSDEIEGFLELGHMGNVATSDLDARASKIASFIGGTASAAQKVTYFDIGLKYRVPVFVGSFRPYIGMGIGTAKVNTEVNFAINGTDVTAQLPTAYGVVLGNDLSGSLTKFYFVLPIGLQGTVMRRILLDVSYRYGHIKGSPDDIVQDVGINAQRVQVAVGIRF